MKNNKTPKEIIRANDTVSVKVVRDEIELHTIELCNRQPVVKRLCKGQHVNIKTGEIYQDKVTTKRGESMASLIASNIMLKDIIKENTIDCKKLLLLTLTYKQKHLDISKLNYDFKQFMINLRKSYTAFGAIEYVNTYELYLDKQGYHIHAILFFNQSETAVFIPHAEIKTLWAHGSITVGQPKRQQEVYYYLTPHLADKVTAKNYKMHNKALLQMELPAGQRLFRYSKGIKRPTIYTDNYANVKLYLKENAYELTREAVYPNPMQSHRENQLYYSKEYYKKQTKDK